MLRVKKLSPSSLFSFKSEKKSRLNKEEETQNTVQFFFNKIRQITTGIGAEERKKKRFLNLFSVFWSKPVGIKLHSGLILIDPN